MGAFDAVMDANPIALIVLAIVGLIAVGVLLITHWKDVTKAAAAVWHDITGFFTSLWKDITHIFDSVVSFLAGVWHNITSGVTTGFNAVITFVTGIPKKILDALGDLGSILLNAGKAILQGFLNGILSIWKDVTGFFSGIGSWISKHKGPLEADAVLLTPHGIAIMSGLHAGLKAGIPPILATLSNLSGQMGSALGSGPSLSMTGSATLGARTSLAGAGASGAGGGVTFAPVYNLNVAGDVSPQTAQLLDAKIRQHDQQLYSQFQASR